MVGTAWLCVINVEGRNNANNLPRKKSCGSVHCRNYDVSTCSTLHITIVKILGMKTACVSTGYLLWHFD